MGAWGVGSDENDGTYDILSRIGVGFGARVAGSERIPQARIMQMSQDLNRTLTKLSKKYKVISTPGVLVDQTAKRSVRGKSKKRSRSLGKPRKVRIPNTEFAGVVIWALKQGLRVSKIHLELARQQLTYELEQLVDGENNVGWRDPDKRRSAIRGEIRNIDQAIQRGGFGRQGPVKPITHYRPKKKRKQKRAKSNARKLKRRKKRNKKQCRHRCHKHK